EAARLEVDRLEARRIHAEELETERLAAERRRIEAQRLEAERQRLETERLEAERQRVAAEETEDRSGLVRYPSHPDGVAATPSRKIEAGPVEHSPQGPLTAPWTITVPDAAANPAKVGDEPPVWPPLGAVYQRAAPPPAIVDDGAIGVPLPAVRGTIGLQPTATPGPSMVSRIFNQSGGGAARPPSGVRPCAHCALPLSAAAQFCRRCGTRQA
ncbi:MAG: hypothetical protein H0V36_12575, partial [Chloroflexi bacterium]|nr:hypothetical protein [Chloroflexota bacterium]